VGRSAIDHLETTLAMRSNEAIRTSKKGSRPHAQPVRHIADGGVAVWAVVADRPSGPSAGERQCDTEERSAGEVGWLQAAASSEYRHIYVRHDMMGRQVPNFILRFTPCVEMASH
jgi:hypothetical protein